MRGLLQAPWWSAHLAAPILALVVALALSSAGFARHGAAPPVAVTGSTAEVSAFADDGTHGHPHTKTIPGSNFETFNNTATAMDNDFSNDRGGTSEGTQNTTITSPSDLAKITSTGGAKATYFADEFPQDPIGRGSSKLSVTFSVTGTPRPFELQGTLTASSASTVQCTTVIVTLPTGATFKAAAPASCGASGSTQIEEKGVLQPGSYTFSVEAFAQANNPLSAEGTKGSADARFDLTLTVEAPPPPPVVPKLAGKVGPGAKISLTTAAGARAASLPAGAYSLTVRDLSAKDNFHLTGPGVNQKTGVSKKQTVTWKLTFSAGTYRYRSDAHAKLKGSFVVKPLAQ